MPSTGTTAVGRDPGRWLYDRLGGGVYRILASSCVAVLVGGVVGGGAGFAALKLDEYALLSGYDLEMLAFFGLLGAMVGAVSGLQAWLGALAVFALEAAILDQMTPAAFRPSFGRLCCSLVHVPVAGALFVGGVLTGYVVESLGWLILAPFAYLLAVHGATVYGIARNGGSGRGGAGAVANGQ